jgi:hypothetical protein
MRRASAFTAGVLAALWMSAAPALAFEETPAAPAPTPPQVMPEAKSPAAALQSPQPGTAPSTAPTGAKVFGFSLLPKLDFGLELLYSAPQPAELQQGAIADENGELSVLGKIKRHF